MSNDEFRTNKAPLETLDFLIDWSEELALSDPVDQLSSSVWTLEDQHADDLNMTGDNIIGTNMSVVRVTGGGRIGVTHYLVNRVVTIAGMTHQRTIEVKMHRR